MTGPEHYREAERLLAEFEEARRDLAKNHGAFTVTPPVLTAAQVHATLAQAAAQAITSPLGGRMRDDWLEVIWKER